MATVFERGPYLQAAFFCEKVLSETDGVLSLIRVVDRVTQSVASPTAPDVMEPFYYPLTGVIMLKSGPARGTFQVRVDVEPPSGLRKTGPSFTVLLEGEDRGANLILNMNVQFAEQGLYWFDVYFDDTLITRMPFRVVYARTTGFAPPVGR